MIPWVKDFFTNATAFVGLVRGLLLGAGGGLMAYPEMAPMLPKWAGIACMAAAGFIRAGEKNLPKGD